jgi:hemerythrin-like domain-containing protein
MQKPRKTDRRAFIRAAGAIGAGVLLAGCGPRTGPPGGSGASSPDTPKSAEDVSPVEDLMREHGVLRRILLVDAEVLRRLDAGREFPPGALADAAAIVRSFIEDYHEKLEEDFLLPRFRKADRLVDLVDVLLDQHKAGRRLTDAVSRLADFEALKSPENRRTLADSLRQFIGMYSPHAAREDTVLFPELHELVPPDEYDALGDDFEKKERDLFGDDGFEKIVDRVATIEKTLGVYDLQQFTPRE